MSKSCWAALAVAIMCWGCGMQTPKSSVGVDGIDVPVHDDDGDGAVVETPAEICLIAQRMGRSAVVCNTELAEMENNLAFGTSGQFLRFGDCNDQNAQVGPGLPERSNDGVDTNCDGMLAPGECLNGTSMPDGNACNGDEVCQNGSPVAGAPRSCDDLNSCTADSCNPATGCVNTPVANGTGCSDGNACTQADTCQAGACVGGNLVVCAALDSCHSVGACDPATGACTNPVMADGTGCDDGNACTQIDTCQAGACTAGPAANCNDSNDCTTDTCDPVGGCAHTNVANGTMVPDGDLCNGSETCQNGALTPGTRLNCNDNESCTSDACAPARGCVNTAVLDGVSCSDGNVCNGAETCLNGVCDPGTPRANCASCNNDLDCAGSRPAGLSADYIWGCTVNNGPPSGICVSCLDVDGDGVCVLNESDCGNGFDENGNGLVDCEDSQCNQAANCATACQTDAQCIAGQVCLSGTCRTPVSECGPFTLEVPANTQIKKIWFWPAAGPGYLQEVLISATSSNQQLVAPPEACAYTVEYDNRWNTVEAKTFPVGPPAAPSIVARLDDGRQVQACVLTYETGAWGGTHDGASCATAKPAGW